MFIDEYIERKLKLIKEEFGEELNFVTRRVIANDVCLIFGIHQVEYDIKLTRIPSMTKEVFF